MHDETLYDEKFVKRMTQLRMEKGVSARDMSLSIGQNPGYINNIESGKALPSMANFFYICEYLDIEPKDFFDFSSDDPAELQAINDKLKLLNPRQLELISALIDELIASKG